MGPSGAERLALETFREFGCSERCSFRAKDITLSFSFAGAHANVVMLNDCLHYFEPETVRDLLSHAVDVLAPEGMLLVATQLLGPDGISPAAAAGFSMHMMLNTAHGGLHATSWIAGAHRRQGALRGPKATRSHRSLRCSPRSEDPALKSGSSPFCCNSCSGDLRHR